MFTSVIQKFSPKHTSDVIIPLSSSNTIYSIYSQPITTRYMQIGTIEAKYKEKNKLTIHPVIINQPMPAQDPTPPNPFSEKNKTEASICGHIIKYQDDFLELHPGCISGAECALRNKEISNEATILVLDGKKCTISAQYTDCIVECFSGNEADRRIAAR